MIPSSTLTDPLPLPPGPSTDRLPALASVMPPRRLPLLLPALRTPAAVVAV